jgi:AraC-like DNA-binding protein
MEAEFTLPDKEKFEIEYALPQAYRGRILRGANVITAIGETGSVIIQTYAQPLFTIRYKQVVFFQNVTLFFHQKVSRLYSFLALKSTHHYHLQNLGAVKLKEGQFSVLQNAQASFSTKYEKNENYHSLEIDWAEEIIKEGLPFFPLTGTLLNKAPFVNSFIGGSAHHAGSDLLGLANEILRSPYDAAISALLFDYKVREYYLLIMVMIGKVPASGLHLTQEQWAKIDEIAQMLKDNPDKRFPISKLAGRAQMNTMKFKQAFKEKYHSGAFEFQMAQRMQEALEILQDGSMNTKQVAAYIGYKGLGSFITKFREYHGFPPGKVQKNL